METSWRLRGRAAVVSAGCWLVALVALAAMLVVLSVIGSPFSLAIALALGLLLATARRLISWPKRRERARAADRAARQEDPREVVARRSARDARSARRESQPVAAPIRSQAQNGHARGNGQVQLDQLTKRALMERARALQIPRRSKMSKRELIDAITSCGPR